MVRKKRANFDLFHIAGILLFVLLTISGYWGLGLFPSLFIIILGLMYYLMSGRSIPPLTSLSMASLVSIFPVGGFVIYTYFSVFRFFSFGSTILSLLVLGMAVSFTLLKYKSKLSSREALGITLISFLIISIISFIMFASMFGG